MQQAAGRVEHSLARMGLNALPLANAIFVEKGLSTLGCAEVALAAAGECALAGGQAWHTSQVAGNGLQRGRRWCCRRCHLQP